jgi:hypothetical protein
LWPHLTPGSHDFMKLAFELCQKAFTQMSAVLARWFLRGRIIKIFSYINISKKKNSFHYCGLIRPTGVMILTDLNLYCQNAFMSISAFLDQKFLRKFLNDPLPHFYFFVIISPLKRTWPFIWTNLNSLYLRIICKKFDWLWPSGSRDSEKIFKIFECTFTLSLLSPLGEGRPPSFE